MISLEGDYLTLRPLPETDLPQLLKVYQGTPLYFEGLGFDVGALTLEDVQAQWQLAHATPNRKLLGVYHIETNLLVGVADVQLGQPQPGDAAIWLLLIWGGFQRQGYGQECLALLDRWFGEYGIEELWAVVAANEEGRSFFQLQGFHFTNVLAKPPIAHGRAFWMRRYNDGCE